MRSFHISLGILVLSVITTAGCMNASTPAPTTTMPAAAMVTPPAAKDLTHTLTKDEPYFASEPTGGAPAPAGMLKSGSKVLVVIPGAMYSQVITETGVSAYTLTDGLQPLGK